MSQSAASRVISVAGNALPDHLRTLVDALKAGDPFRRVTVVTPGFYSSFYLRRSLASHGLLNVEFVRIEDLADILAAEASEPEDGYALTRLEAAELVRAAVSECVAAGELDGPIAELSGQASFLAALHRSLGELEAEQSDREISLRGLAEAELVTRAVGKTWDTYQRLKKRHGLIDRTQVAGRAVDAIDTGALERQHIRLSIGELVVLAITPPAPQYRKLWQKLASSDRTAVILGATDDEQSDQYVAGEFGLQPQSVNNPGAIPVPEAVCATDTRSEIAAVVRRIASQASSGALFNRIAVFYADPAYAARIRPALSMADIPVSGPSHEELASSPAGRFLSGVLQMSATGFARQAVADWLATCSVHNPLTSAPVTGTEWDRISRVARVGTGVDSWENRLARFAKLQRSRAARIEHESDDGSSGAQTAAAFESQAARAESLRDFAVELAKDLTRPGETATWSTWADWLDGIIERYLHAPAESAAAESAESIRTLLDRVRALDRLTSESADSPDFARFSATVRREISSRRSSADRLGRGVFVANIRDAAASRFDHVHIVGMADGMFPSPDTADPLLPDQVRQQLNTRFGLQLSLSSDRKELRRRQFLDALASGKSATLYWSRSSGPSVGETGPAQWLIDQVRRHPGNESLHAGELLRRPGEITGVTAVEYGDGKGYSDVSEFEVTSVRAHTDRANASTAHWLESNEESGVPAALRLESGRYGQSLTPWSGDLSEIAELVPSISGEVLSASRIESFAGCPLRYMFGYVLKVDTGIREEDSFYLPPDRRGTLIHSVLETYLNLRIRDHRPPGAETLDEAMNEVVVRWERDEPDTTGQVWRIEIQEIRRRLRRWLDAETALEAEGFSPWAAELSFGRSVAADSEQQYPAIEIALDDSTVLRFGGIIDRLEQRGDSYYVIDYKTGTPRSYSTLDKDPVDRGRHLQLALYSKAVEQLLSPSEQLMAGYWFVMDPKQSMKPDPELFDPELAESRLDDVLKAFQRTNESGHFPPNPGERAWGGGGGASFENCRYCDFDRVCPANSRRDRMLRGHTKDPRLAPYFDLTLDRDGEPE